MEIVFNYNIPINERGRNKTELMIYGIYTQGKELFLRTVDEDGGSDISLSELLNSETAIEVDEVRALDTEITMKEKEISDLLIKTKNEKQALDEEIAVLEAQRIG